MKSDFVWSDDLALDVQFGYLNPDAAGPRRFNPKVVLNSDSSSVLRAIREELPRCDEFLFSVAFVSPRAIALLKQEMVEFQGRGSIVTSDYLSFNSPAAFAELLNLRQLGIDVRIHPAKAFHPKGYLFRRPDSITAMMGSSNFTHTALVTNHEWNLKVTAAASSDLGQQLATLMHRHIAESTPLSQGWIDAYTTTYTPPPPRPPRMDDRPVVPPVSESLPLFDVQPRLDPPPSAEPSPRPPGPEPVLVPDIEPNAMQQVALMQLEAVRAQGNHRAIVISATGTGKTMLSALDARSVDPIRLLFVVHREQILDRTILEYRKVLGGPQSDYGKLTGTTKQQERRYVFATVQTLSQPDVLTQFAPDAFDYVIIDEAHRAGAHTYQRVLDHFTPEFLLGMTATPERTDGFNVFELFDYNVPYEIRLSHALEEDMLAPFHYYGVTDLIFEDGSTVSDEEDLHVLITPERVDHLIKALEVYGQAGVAPRGLIFCSRKDEARALADRLNRRTLRGKQLQTVALTGDDTIPHREEQVARLESGELDYILTVDIFNEGVDIPTVNQVVMLRQTQSAIVFVQQLGRGLRKAVDKDYLVVIDFIGNYANNYLIPIALFGDESLNKESLRQKLIAAEESGVLPGLSSVRFDKIAQERVLRSISTTRLDSMQNLKKSIEMLRNRLGHLPSLTDFIRFESTDPVLLATKAKSYPDLLERLYKKDPGLTEEQLRILEVLSHEVLTSKRPHEHLLVRMLLEGEVLSLNEIAQRLVVEGVTAELAQVRSAVDSLTLANHAEADLKRYRGPIAKHESRQVRLISSAIQGYRNNTAFTAAVDDVLEAAQQLVDHRYSPNRLFTPGWQYSRKEATRILTMPRKWTSTLYGYKVDRETGTCPIFVTLHKGDDITASTAYEDTLLDQNTLLWYTRSRRTLLSEEVRRIVNNEVDLHVFVKKDDAEGSDFYYLGQATSSEAEQTTILDDHGKSLPIVRMLLRFDQPIESALFDYFHPVVTH